MIKLNKHIKKAPTKALVEQYKKGYSCQQIATMFSMSRQAVWERLKTNGIELRKKKILPFVMYDGIKFTPSGNGYYRATRRDKHISLHRYKYQKEVRQIPDDWDVHHKDGNKLNNDITNLIAMPKAEHTKLHRNDKNNNIQ